jgi:hypothetical protein
MSLIVAKLQNPAGARFDWWKCATFHQLPSQGRVWEVHKCLRYRTPELKAFCNGFVKGWRIAFNCSVLNFQLTTELNR